MLSSVLHSNRAVQMNIAIMRAFVEMRRLALDEHDAQLNAIYDALENLLDDKAAQRKWENRDRIGFNRAG